MAEQQWTKVYVPKTIAPLGYVMSPRDKETIKSEIKRATAYTMISLGRSQVDGLPGSDLPAMRNIDIKASLIQAVE